MFMMLHFIMGLIFLFPCIFLVAQIRLEVTSLKTWLEFGSICGALFLTRSFVIPLKCKTQLEDSKPEVTLMNHIISYC